MRSTRKLSAARNSYSIHVIKDMFTLEDDYVKLS